MKQLSSLIKLLSISAALILSSCDFINIDSSSNSVTTSEESITNSESTSEVTNELMHLSITNSQSQYYVGDIYLANNHLVVKAHYSNGDQITLNYDENGTTGYSLSAYQAINHQAINLNEPFLTAGLVYLKASYLGITSEEISLNIINQDTPIVYVQNIISDVVSLTLDEGESQTIAVTVLPQNATNKILNYSSSDTKVATFSNGVVKAIKQGNAILTIASSDGSNVTLSIPLTVNEVVSDNEGYYRYQNPLKHTVKDYQDSMGYDSLYTTGEQKLLIVPVKFSDGPAFTNEMLNNLEIAFFGDASETNYWESVKSYYEKSSYGQLTFSGEVTSVLNINISSSTFATRYNSEYENGVETYISEQFYRQADSALLKEYDADNNGHVDATVFIYSNSYGDYSDSEAYQNAFWAWVFYISNAANLNKPTIANYMWASYDFLLEGTSSGLDTHTYIHETGHLLGSDDFYSRDSYDPVGSLEMQSYNVGDLSIFSKFQFNWVEPYLLDATIDEVEIPLRSSALYGDAILINDNWNGGSGDEYLLIEYYTPEGNNTLDSKTAYNGRNRMYTETGLRIYHVDARLVKIEVDNWGYYTTYGYSDEIKDDGYVYFPGASNYYTQLSYLDSPYNSVYKLVEIIQANVTSSSDRDSVKNGGDVSNASLYQIGDKFTPASYYFYNGYNKFNDNSNIGYTIELVKENSGVATVKITKI